MDELYSGVPAVGAAGIREGLATSYAATLGVLFAVPGAAALLVEPALFVLADRYPRKWFVCGGLLAMGVAAIAAALAPSASVLAVATAVAWIGSGSGVVLAQATLVDGAPDRREQVLARWALLGELGDLGAPLLVAGLSLLSLGWRAAYLVVGVATLAWAAWLAFQTFPRPAAADDEEECDAGVLAALTAALKNRRLMVWLGATALCDLLDDVLVVFAALHLRDTLGMSAVERSMVIGAGVAGAIVGAVATERLLERVAPLRLLVASSLGCALLYAGWCVAPSAWLSALLFAAVGATAAPMYPIASARAYAALPGRSGTVNAAGHLFTPLTLALPWALGALADATDVRVALVVLIAQPLGLAVVGAGALLRRRRSARPTP